MCKDKRHIHDFEPTDSQGYSMICIKCGLEISIYERDSWDKAMKEECHKKSEADK
jgi:hypothetical protein